MAKKQSRKIQSRYDLGQTLRQAAARLDAWKQERAAIAAELTDVLTSAKRLLGDLGHDVKALALEVTEPRARKGGRPKGYKVSAATRRKLREAWKRRKDAEKAGDKK